MRPIASIDRPLTLRTRADLIAARVQMSGADTWVIKDPLAQEHFHFTAEEYVRMIALSRILLPNIDNIQASWLTVGKATAQLCLHAGANDFGSIMIEENVVSAAGAPHRFTSAGIQEAIREAGFEPRLRDQQYGYRIMPEVMEQQEITY